MSYNESIDIEIVEATVPLQKVIVNGQEQVIEGKVYAIVCPKCKTILQQFQPGISKSDIIKSLETEDENLLNRNIFCMGCGQSLKLMRPMPIEAENVEVLSEEIVQDN